MVGVDTQETNRPSASDESFNYLFKVVLIGPESVGKSAILSRFADNSFTEAYRATIGVDFKTKNVTTSNNEVVKLQVWDTAGQERYRVISHAYYRGAHGIMLVFDITNESSFQSMDSFYTEVREKAYADCSIVLVGTHSDSKDRREVTEEQAEEFAARYGINYIEVSAETGDEVSSAFQILVEKMVKNHTRDVPLAPMSTMPHDLRSRAKAKTSDFSDEDSLHELGNLSDTLKLQTGELHRAARSSCCTIL